MSLTRNLSTLFFYLEAQRPGAPLHQNDEQLLIASIEKIVKDRSRIPVFLRDIFIGTAASMTQQENTIIYYDFQSPLPDLPSHPILCVRNNKILPPQT